MHNRKKVYAPSTQHANAWLVWTFPKVNDGISFTKVNCRGSPAKKKLMKEIV